MFLRLQKRMESNPYEYNWPSLRQDSSSLVGGEKSSMYVSRCRFPHGSAAKKTPAMQEVRVWPLGREDLLEEEMATQSGILAWEILHTEEPGWLWVHEVVKELDTTKRLNNMCPDADR